MEKRSKNNISCHRCKVREFCLGPSIGETHLEEVTQSIEFSRHYKRGDHIYLAPERPEYLFAIYSGCCKEYYIDQEGDETINEFYFPGDIIGLEYLYKDYARFSVQALEPMTVCVIPLKHHKFSAKHFHPVVMWQAVGRYLAGQLVPHTTDVQCRVAAFFMKLIYRQQMLYGEVCPLPVPITLQQISQKIGIANETLSRTLLEFKNRGLLVVSKHKVVEYDMEGLEELSGVEFGPSLHRQFMDPLKESDTGAKLV